MQLFIKMILSDNAGEDDLSCCQDHKSQIFLFTRNEIFLVVTIITMSQNFHKEGVKEDVADILLQWGGCFTFVTLSSDTFAGAQRTEDI